GSPASCIVIFLRWRPALTSHPSRHLNYDNVESVSRLHVRIVREIQPARSMRFTPLANPSRSRPPVRRFVLAFAFFQIIALSHKLSAQESRGGEIVANLATGRVVFCVAHDAI